MKAVRIDGPREVTVADVACPEPHTGELLVQVEHAALCATDRKMLERGVDSPLIPGHEGVGRLEDGTLVGVHPDVGCGRCRHCRAGVETRCSDKRPVGVRRHGALAEWVTVRGDHAIPLDGLDPVVAPVLEPLACCLHAVDRLDVTAGTPALVVGGGAMGVLNMWALQAAGCTVAVSEPLPQRRQMALDLGADAAIQPGVSASVALGEPPRAAVVTVPGARVLDAALQEVDVGGTVHAFASVPGGATVDVNLVHKRHLRLVGTTGSDIGDYERARELVLRERVPLHRLPVAHVSLRDVPAWLRADLPSDALKTVVDVGGRAD